MADNLHVEDIKAKWVVIVYYYPARTKAYGLYWYDSEAEALDKARELAGRDHVQYTYATQALRRYAKRPGTRS